jgi:hypothetical protein
MRKVRNAYKRLVGEPGEKRSLGRCRRGWEDNIKIDLKEKCGKPWTGFIWVRIGTSGGLM